MAAVRRRLLRAADRVRERRESDARARERSRAGDRGSHGARRGALADRAATVDGERDLVRRGRRARLARGFRRNPRVVGREHGRLVSARRRRSAARRGLAGRRVHGVGLDRDRDRLRPAARADHVARRSEFGDQARERPFHDRTWKAPEPVDSRRRGNRFGRRAPDRRRTIDQDDGRAECDRSRRQRGRRRGHAHTAVRGTIPGRDADSRSRAEHARQNPRDSGRRSGGRDLLRAAAGELGRCLQDRRQGRRRPAVYERRRRDDQHRRLLRRVRGPGRARPRIRGTRRCGQHARDRHQPRARRPLVAGRARPDRAEDSDRRRPRRARARGDRHRRERSPGPLGARAPNDVRSVRAALRYVAQESSAGRLAGVDRSNERPIRSARPRPFATRFNEAPRCRSRTSPR